MAHISVPPPSPVAYPTALSVQISNLNYGNHLANHAVLRLCHECRKHCGMYWRPSENRVRTL
ncbi:MAG: hypothetical protein Q4D63_05995 [Neisseria animaloris]|uniref:hypothetical protein n=1 Tax=Neisseria animaloris TaxID=326522 RepID=UPI00131B59CF|nr:hypothetical protein [Neisseria animaloris]MDO5073936.1 hypothetical protein [Neisseria animaloris]